MEGFSAAGTATVSAAWIASGGVGPAALSQAAAFGAAAGVAGGIACSRGERSKLGAALRGWLAALVFWAVPMVGLWPLLGTAEWVRQLGFTLLALLTLPLGAAVAFALFPPIWRQLGEAIDLA